MATPRLGLVVEDKPTELSCLYLCGLLHSCGKVFAAKPLTSFCTFWQLKSNNSD